MAQDALFAGRRQGRSPRWTVQSQAFVAITVFVILRMILSEKSATFRDHAAAAFPQSRNCRHYRHSRCNFHRSGYSIP
jgi:hypothetical protein